MPFVLPKDTQRLVIVGRTGTGKTQAAAWQLAMRRLGDRKWIIFDFKHDALLNEIGATEISLGTVPKKSGLYIVHPMPGQEEEIEAYLWAIWAVGHIGIFIDEGYMIRDSSAFRAILTQGRSKHIPMIILSQRPNWISRFVFSEADFYQVFDLNDSEDRKTIGRFIPYDFNDRGKRPEKFCSVYYDVGDDCLMILRPAPDAETILTTFDEKLEGTKSRLRVM